VENAIVDGMGDPAAEALNRVRCAAWQFVDPPGAAEDVARRAINAALQPTRELHSKLVVKAVVCPEDCEEHDDDCPLIDVAICRGCYRLGLEVHPYFEESSIAAVMWPCATAHLVYAESELP
jgi:hypothetical protein